MSQDDLKKKIAMMQALSRQQEQARKKPEAPAAYREFGATELYCNKCKKSMPVRQKMLLSLPSGDMYDYLCVGCGASLGTKTGR